MRYEKPTEIEDACALLRHEAGLARVLTGGTDLLVQLKSELVEPELIVDIKHIGGMRSIIAEEGGYRIGAAVSGAEMAEHAGLSALWPGVVEATGLIGSTQVQGRASMAGNLCNGSPSADSVPAMFAANAIARIHGAGGARECPVCEIPVGPGKTALAKDDIITSIFLPARPKNASDAYLRFIPRTEMDIAVASAGVNLTLDATGVCTSARVAIGAVAPTVLLVANAGEALVGSKLDEAALAQMVAAVEAACNPITDKRGTIEYRTKTAGVLAKRAALIAQARAGGQT
ncbi:MAG: xanthine dehydrogenase family protein subunit M [Sulfitobacter sp.]